MTIITRKREVAARYLEYLEREIAMLADALQGRRTVVQHHWGGGTPTYLTLAQIERLARRHRAALRRSPRRGNGHRDRSAGHDAANSLRLLRSLGFNRLSMGVQDFTPEVQDAIGRHQPEAQTRDLYDYARAIGFNAHQLRSDLRPAAADRRVLHAARWRRSWRCGPIASRCIPTRTCRGCGRTRSASMPRSCRRAIVKLELIGAAIDAFIGAGYKPIGMDHFALADDELAVAARERRLHRNFMGYTTRPATDMVGVGVSAIGDVCGAFAQNVKKLPAYYAAIDARPVPDRARLRADRRRLHPPARHRRADVQLLRRSQRGRRAIRHRLRRVLRRRARALSAPGGPVADGLLDISAGRPRGDAARAGCSSATSACTSTATCRATGRPVFSRTI